MATREDHKTGFYSFSSVSDSISIMLSVCIDFSDSVCFSAGWAAGGE